MKRQLNQILISTWCLFAIILFKPTNSQGIFGRREGGDPFKALNPFAQMRCFGDLGCFEAERPCISPIGGYSQPFAPNDQKVEFFFYSATSPSTAYPLSYSDSKFEEKLTLDTKLPFNGQRETVFVTHGFTAGSTDGQFRDWINKLRTMEVSRKGSNFVIVNWPGGANLVTYTQAKLNARVVGAMVAQTINLLIKGHDARPEAFTLVGHSLGAHVMSYAGKRVKSIGKIVGLDPAGPCFDDTDSLDRLAPSDAHIVEVIHTNALPLLDFERPVGMGSVSNLGHLDFWPNGGETQPGCPLPPRPRFATSIMSADHAKYGACQPVAYNCTSREAFLNGLCTSCAGGQCQLMAFDSQIKAKSGLVGLPRKGSINNLFIETQGQEPYCTYHFQVVVTVATNSPVTGKLVVELTGRRSGRVELKDTFVNGGKYKGMLLVPELADRGGQPGPFKTAQTEFTPISDSVQVVSVKEVEFNYLSDQRPKVRARFSGVLTPKTRGEF